MGIDIRDSNGNIKPTGDLLLEVAEEFKRVEDPALRAAAASALFGRSGVNLVNTLAQGADAIRAQGDEVERLGVITDEQARASERYIDSMARLRGAVNGLGFAFGAELLPILEPVLVNLKDLAVSSRPEIVAGLKRGVSDLSELFSDARRLLGGLVERVGEWGAAIERTVPFITPMVRAIGEWINRTGWLRIVVVAVASALSARLIVSVLALFGPLARLGVALLATAAKLVILGAAGVLAAGRGLFRLGGALLGVIPLLAAFGKALLLNPLVRIVLAVLALAGAVVWVYRNWDGIVEWMQGLWRDIKAALDIDGIVDKLKGGDIAGAVKGWFTGLAGGGGRAME